MFYQPPSINPPETAGHDKLRLNVTIDTQSGFCFGVVYAIEMAEEILDSEGTLYCLGDIVHNDQEIQRLTNKGLQTIDHEQFAKIHNAKVLIRAHGEPPSTYKTALENNITLIDASCPVVLKVQNRIQKSHQRNLPVYIYGKPGHAEVVGLLGQTEGDAVVFQSVEELDVTTMPRRILLYSQTTKSRTSFHEIHKVLVANGIEVELHDTICRQVSNRDNELRSFARRFDVVLFASGVNSSNGNVLYNVCKAANPNTWFVGSATDVQKSWFKKNETVGICGATSTPMWLMEEIKAVLATW